MIKLFMKKIGRGSNHGVILLDLIISLGVSAIILGITFQFLSSTVSLKRLEQDRYQIEQFRSTIRSQLLNYLESLDTHRLEIPFIVHKEGEIRLFDGSLSALHFGNFPPDADSDGFSFLNIEHHCALGIKSSEIFGSNSVRASVIDLAPPSLPCPPINTDQILIGITIDSLYYLKVTQVEQFGPDLFLTLHSGPNLFLEAATQSELSALQILYPVSNQATIYLDSLSRIRFAALSGDLIVENQPLGGSLSSLQIESFLTQPERVQIVKAHLEYKEKNLSSILLHSRLGRLFPHDYALRSDWISNGTFASLHQGEE